VVLHQESLNFAHLYVRYELRPTLAKPNQLIKFIFTYATGSEQNSNLNGTTVFRFIEKLERTRSR